MATEHGYETTLEWTEALTVGAAVGSVIGGAVLIAVPTLALAPVVLAGAGAAGGAIVAALRHTGSGRDEVPPLV